MLIEKFKASWMAITYSCNNNCRWCYVGDNLNNKKTEMQLEDVKKFSKLLSELNVPKAILIGGEPTTHPDLLEIVEILADRGLNTYLVTNGRKLSDKGFVMDLKNAGLKKVTISIEGADENTHDFNTSIKGSFRETILGFQNCLDLDLGVYNETTISNSNKENLEGIVDLLYDIGLKEVAFNVCTPCLSRLKKSQDTVSPIEGAKIIERLYLYGKERNISVRSITPLPYCNFDNKISDEMKEKGLLALTCQIFYGDGFVIDHNGDILPCVHFTGYPLFNIKKGKGIINKDTFLEVYNNKSENSYKFRKALWKYPSIKCEKDDLWGKCFGGCPIFWVKYDPDNNIRGLKDEKYT